MRLSDLAELPLTYAEIGATAGALPQGYHHLRESAIIGHGRPRFEEAAAEVMRWGMQRGAGLRVDATTDVAGVGSEIVVGIGPLQVPCRVVYVVDEPNRRGFAYGTLAGHAESGEELFSARFDEVAGTVHAEIVAFSRPGTWWSRLGGPVTSLAQRVATKRYLRALQTS